MCGIVGFIDRTGQVQNADVVIQEMSGLLSHRGPDDSGQWSDKDVGVSLGHRRLSVVDLSPLGHQPMNSTSGRYVIAFNGEIYNFEDLRTKLVAKGHQFRGHSDTEVLLAAISQWGVDGAVGRSTGMFAFALWDRENRSLTLARDRMGEKPLYYGWVGGSFVFSSELKAFSAFPGWRPTLNRDSIAMFMRHAYIPAPSSIFEKFYKLPPASLITVSSDTLLLPEPSIYWSLDDIAVHGKEHLIESSDSEAVDALDSLIHKAVANQMVADVPLGAFLSGGVDSSVVAAVMQAESSRPIKSFSIGFDDKRYDEAVDAREVARHLGTEHTELYVTPRDALDVIPDLPFIYDEPFADPSQIPTMLLCRMTREQVTVAISGDGGDELFGGYNRYSWGDSIWRRIRHVPRPLRQFAANLVVRVSANAWNRVGDFAMRPLPSKYHVRRPGDRLHKLAGVLDVSSQDELYDRLISTWRQPIVKGSTATRIDNRSPFSGRDFVDHMMLSDMKGYLPGDILTKVDRAAMAASLETRIPFLDHQLVEFSWKLPRSMKIRNGEGKWLLRRVLDRYVPNHLIDRPKAGFGVPLDEWLRGPLRDWADSLLMPEKLKAEGYLFEAPIQQLWGEHLSGRRNWQYPLWNVLMFQSWLERWTSGD